jgi:hypothetical protein
MWKCYVDHLPLQTYKQKKKKTLKDYNLKCRMFTTWCEPMFIFVTKPKPIFSKLRGKEKETTILFFQYQGSFKATSII